MPYSLLGCCRRRRRDTSKTKVAKTAKTDDISTQSVKAPHRFANRQRRQITFSSLFQSLSNRLQNPSSIFERRKREEETITIDLNEMNARGISCKGVTGSGTFGVVYKAHYARTPTSLVAVKRIELDEESETRESICLCLQEVDLHKLCRHPNVIGLKESWTKEFYDGPIKKFHIYMVMEFFPANLEEHLHLHAKEFTTIPAIMIKVFMFQLFRATNYLHVIKILHRDIKPSNCLVDIHTGMLKVCDFGCAKRIKRKGTPNRTYICSRYYRAPELVLNNTRNDENIDVWAAACVLAECYRGWPLFPGKSAQHQFGAIADVLGNPSAIELYHLNPKIKHINVKLRDAGGTFDEHFPPKTPEVVLDLLSKMLVYTPHERLPCLDALADSYFDQLRKNSKTLILPSGKAMPQMFDFSPQELSKASPDLVKRLLPADRAPSDLCYLDDPAYKTKAASISLVASIDSMSTDSEANRTQIGEVFSELESDDVDEQDVWDCQKVRLVDEENR